MRFILKKTIFIIFVVLLSFMGIEPGHAANKRSSPALQPIWDKLEAARTYREDWRGLGKTHDELINSYKNDPVLGYEPKTPQELFMEAAKEFRSYLENPSVGEEATWGLQEALNEYMSGQLLIGNDYLIKGLRVRFPGTGDPDDPDQLTLLKLGTQAFQNGIDQLVEDLRGDPESMRSSGIVNPQFPFYVENTIKEGEGQGELVENELYRFASLVERNAMANNSVGKRMFFFGNVKDVDNFPYGNFPGEEDLDLNGNGILDAAGREDAAKKFEESAQATYFHTAVLMAVQTEEEFEQNNGYQLKRQILDAQRVFDDILAGFNPLGLLGDFVPYQPVENIFQLARKAVDDAIVDERAAKNALRLYDQDETTLRQTLESQQLTYLDRIEQLTGLNVQDYKLFDKDDRERLFNDAEENAKKGLGQMGLQRLKIEEAQIGLRHSQNMLFQIQQKIMIEQARITEITQLIFANGAAISTLSFMETMYSSTSISASTSTTIGTTGPIPEVSQTVGASVSSNPCASLLAGVRSTKDLLNAVQQAGINSINSAATIKQLVLDGVLALISFERAFKIMQQENARLDELRAEFQRTVKNYLSAQKDLISAYFMNPAYRLDRDQLVEASEKSFESAMVECYYAAKSLEYLWAEKFNNPVNRIDGLLPEPLSHKYDPYIRAESIFSVKFAEIKSPNLDGFLDALQAWDVKMRQLRHPEGQGSHVTISLRKDVLGYEGLNEENNRLLFRDFIANHREKGLNPDNPDLMFEFSLELADSKLFDTDHPNIKIEEIRIELISSPVRSIAGPGTTSAPARVNLTMLDEASIRTFFSDYPTDDDLLILDLEEGRTLAKSPFFATIDATIDGYSNPAAVPNTQLAGHSPAVTRWILWIKMDSGNNRFLRLEHLDDIQIQIFYHYGKPQQVAFP